MQQHKKENINVKKYNFWNVLFVFFEPTIKMKLRLFSYFEGVNLKTFKEIKLLV